MESDSEIPQQDKEEINKLDINTVYNEYIDLYIHLDEFKYNFLPNTIILFGSLITFIFLLTDPKYNILQIFNNLISNAVNLLFLGFLSLLIGILIYRYHLALTKFGIGQDYIALALANIEKKNPQIFDKDILNPREQEAYPSFFIRKEKQMSVGMKERHIFKEKKRLDLIVVDFFKYFCYPFCFIGILLILFSCLIVLKNPQPVIEQTIIIINIINPL